jgi:hypothetical protein
MKYPSWTPAARSHMTLACYQEPSQADDAAGQGACTGREGEDSGQDQTEGGRGAQRAKGSEHKGRCRGEAQQQLVGAFIDPPAEDYWSGQIGRTRAG